METSSIIAKYRNGEEGKFRIIVIIITSIFILALTIAQRAIIKQAY